MVYYDKRWHEGDEPGGEILDPQPDKPKYRAGWTIRYNHLGRSHVGTINYVQRGTHIDFYSVTRTKTGLEEVTFDCSITGRIEA